MGQATRLAHHEATAVSPTGPLSAEDLAAYLDGRLTGRELERVEAALAFNPDARAELVEAARLIATIPARADAPKRQRILTVAVAAAAVFAIVLLPTLARKPARTQADTERRGTPEAARIQAISPSNGAVVPPTEAHFAWNSVSGAVYQLTLTDTNGGVVWQTTTGDTTLALPAIVKLEAQRSYYWNVDALAANGSSVTTGIRELKVGAK
ncbi:MAG: zf-HC2 domain-containing protein [Gemmatimonadaceae bacterium]